MNKRVVWLVPLSLVMGALMWLLLTQSATTQETAAVNGIVIELDSGPVAGATVRQQTTSNATTSAEDGSFTLNELAEGIQTTITAWQEGYFVGFAPGRLLDGALRGPKAHPGHLAADRLR